MQYRDRNHSFGQQMLTLRNAIGLTQTGLATKLGVSRRTVGAWEAGAKYPTAVHLKQCIALALEHKVWDTGRETAAVHSLWQDAHQKIPLDETWLATLLSSTANTIDHNSEQSSAGTITRTSWSDAPALLNLYGREQELGELTRWVNEDHCRVISVLGMGGIGKSALTVSLMHRLAGQFHAVIWRSLRDIPTCDVLLNDLLQTLGFADVAQVPGFEERMARLMEQLRSTRVLLVLDNLESLLQEGAGTGDMRPEYWGFARFLQLSAGTMHSSCVLLTSREQSGDLVPLEGKTQPVRTLRLARLEAAACEQLLAEKSVHGSAGERARLIRSYAGNPLALKIVGQTIAELFEGEIAPFLAQGEIIFGGIRKLLDEQVQRLTPLECSVLFWLAILREPVTLDELSSVMVAPVPRASLLEAVDALRRRSLIEPGQTSGSFTLQSVVLEYATALLISKAAQEISTGQLTYLIEYGLVSDQVPEHVREPQERLLVAPVLARVRGQFAEPTALRGRLTELLALTRRRHAAHGYAPANLATFLRVGGFDYTPN